MAIIDLKSAHRIGKEIKSSKKCKYCLEPFVPTNVRQIYCSIPCRSAMSCENLKKYRKKSLKYPESYQGEQHEAYIIEASQIIYDKILKVHFIPIKQELKLVYINTFFEVWKKIKEKTKYRSPFYSCPVFAYIFLKVEGIYLEKRKIKNHFSITEKEFRKGMSLLIPLYERYIKRDKKEIVINHTKDTTEALEMGHPFFKTALRIIDVFWPQLKPIKEDLGTGVVLLLSFITLDLPSAKFSEACKQIKVKVSSVYNAVNSYILNKLPFVRFCGFRKSSDYLRAFIDARLGKSE